MGLYKRGNVWWMSITPTKRGKVERISCGTADKQLAERIYFDTRLSIAEGRWFPESQKTQPNQERTIHEMIWRYVQEFSPLKKPKSHQRDRQCAAILCRIIRDTPLIEATAKRLSGYKGVRREEGAAPATINKEMILLSSAFTAAIYEWEWCNTNPMDGIKRERITTQIIRWLTVEEEARLLEVAPQWLRQIIVFALNTGMRRSEIMACRWVDVDIEQSTIHIPTSKNGRPRTIPINTHVFTVLVEMGARSRYRDGVVFAVDRGGVQFNPRSVSRAFQMAVDRAKLDRVRFHDLRHTFATRIIQSGIDVYTVMQLMGHRSIASTQIYAHHSTKSLRPGVEALDDIRVEG